MNLKIKINQENKSSLNKSSLNKTESKIDNKINNDIKVLTRRKISIKWKH